MVSKRLGVSKSEFRDALTHFSFFEDKKEEKGNGRLIFAGMFVFRGELARVLAQYYPGSGTQLQHTIGNLLKNERLYGLFDEWGIKPFIRASETFDISQHKHIFVFAILGCVALRFSEDELQAFIMRWFLKSTAHKLPVVKQKNRNFRGQADFMAKNIFNCPIQVQLVEQNGIFKATVSVKDGTVLSDASSKSYLYARNKALKMSIVVMAEINMKDFNQNTDYIERIKQRLEEEKNKQIILIEEKQAAKEKRRAELKEKSLKYKAQRDAIRKKAKAEAKKRKESKAALEAVKKAKEAKQISGKKRRFLDDKKK